MLVIIITKKKLTSIKYLSGYLSDSIALPDNPAEIQSMQIRGRIYGCLEIVLPPVRVT